MSAIQTRTIEQVVRAKRREAWECYETLEKRRGKLALALCVRAADGADTADAQTLRDLVAVETQMVNQRVQCDRLNAAHALVTSAAEFTIWVTA